MAFPLSPSKTLCWPVSASLALVVLRIDAFVGEEAGATAIEYALLATSIAVTIAGVCGALFGKLSGVYVEVTNIFT